MDRITRQKINNETEDLNNSRDLRVIYIERSIQQQNTHSSQLTNGIFSMKDYMLRHKTSLTFKRTEIGPPWWHSG